MRKRLLPAAILGCLAFGPGTAAQALTISEYEVTIEGSGDWYRNEIKGGSIEDQAKFTWRTEIPSVTFIDKELGDTSAARVSTGAAETRVDVVVPTPAGALAGFCKGGTAAVRAGTLNRSLLPGEAGEEALDVRVLGGIEVDRHECGGDPIVSPSTLVVNNGRHELGSGPFDARVEMPHEAIGMGKVIELVEGTASGRQCPRWTDATVTCTLRWKATVTLTRKRLQQVDAPPPPEQPDVIVEPPPPPPPPPPPADEIEVLPLEPHGPDGDEIEVLPLHGRLTAAGATVTIACPSGCAGTVTATSRGRRLARSRFTAPAGRPKRVRLRFRRSRGGPVKIEVAAGAERQVLTLRRR